MAHPICTGSAVSALNGLPDFTHSPQASSVPQRFTLAKGSRSLLICWNRPATLFILTLNGGFYGHACSSGSPLSRGCSEGLGTSPCGEWGRSSPLIVVSGLYSALFLFCTCPCWFHRVLLSATCSMSNSAMPGGKRVHLVCGTAKANTRSIVMVYPAFAFSRKLQYTLSV